MLLGDSEYQLNINFTNICRWYNDNKLSINHDEVGTKCIIFGIKEKVQKVGKLNITYKGMDIKLHSSMTYVVCILDKAMSGEPIAFKL